MLNWTGEDGTVIRIEFRGYEFLQTTSGWDANWLNVHIWIGAGLKSWETVSSCFLTHEVIDLRMWLEGMAAGTVNTGDIFATLEPNVSFQYVGYTEQRHSLKIEVSFGDMPRWLAEKSTALRIDLQDHEIASSMAYLAEVESRLPPRGELC